MARIGIFSDKCSLYDNRYPNLRDDVPFYKKMVEDGHEVYLVHPEASPTVMKRWNGELSRDTLNEIFSVGVKPVLENSPIDIDVLYITTLVHGAYNWRDRQYIDDLLCQYAKKTQTIIWRSTDSDFKSQPDTDNYLKSHLVKIGAGWLLDKIKVFAVTSPYNPGIENRCINVPHPYAPWLEIPIKPKSERKYLFRFTGPLGYRKTLMDTLEKTIMPFAMSKGIPCEFYGESFDNFYAKSDFDYKSRIFEAFKTITAVYPDRVFMKHQDYLKFLSEGIFGLHDAILTPYGMRDKADYYSNRLLDAVLAGNFPITTDFNDNGYGTVDLNHYKNIVIQNLNMSMPTILEASDEKFEFMIYLIRKAFNSSFGVDKLWPLIAKHIPQV